MWRNADRWRKKGASIDPAAAGYGDSPGRARTTQVTASTAGTTTAAFPHDIELQERGAGAEANTEYERRDDRRRDRDDHRRRGYGSVGRNAFSRVVGPRKRDKVPGVLAGGILFMFLIKLVDIMKSRRISSELQWGRYYMRAVVEDEDSWHLGWRMEDLAQQAANQRARMAFLLEVLEDLPAQKPDTNDALRRASLAKVLSEEEDLNRVVSLGCATRPGKFVQVGMHAMVASAEAGCKIYSAATTLDPHALFEKIELGEGRFALRAFSNQRFVRVVPPIPADDDNGWLFDWDVWTLEVGSPEVGLPEVFQMRDGMVYSEIMHGYVSCSGSGREAELKGFVGEYLRHDNANYQIIFNTVSARDVERAATLRRISDVVHTEQQRKAVEYITRQGGSASDKKRTDHGGDKAVVIAICVPMTSRGTEMETAEDSPLWRNTFESFLASIDWRSSKFYFHWYLGFDVGDPIYDGAEAVRELRKTFYETAHQWMKGEGMPETTISGLLEDTLLLKPKYYSDKKHAPSHVVSALIQDAYDDGCDYFYQINDDTVIGTPHWAETFTAILQGNPLGSNVGVTGPADTNNRRILTHAFVHRTHIDIFGRYFPVCFRNWWSDDWISNVYGREHTLRDHLVTITHNVKSQKSEANNRYDIDFSAESGLMDELQKGHVQLSTWLGAQGLPPPPFPMVCGYSPLADKILRLASENSTEKHVPVQAEGQGGETNGGNLGGNTAGMVRGDTLKTKERQ